MVPSSCQSQTGLCLFPPFTLRCFDPLRPASSCPSASPSCCSPWDPSYDLSSPWAARSHPMSPPSIPVIKFLQPSPLACLGPLPGQMGTENVTGCPEPTGPCTWAPLAPGCSLLQHTACCPPQLFWKRASLWGGTPQAQWGPGVQAMHGHALTTLEMPPNSFSQRPDKAAGQPLCSLQCCDSACRVAVSTGVWPALSRHHQSLLSFADA